MPTILEADRFATTSAQQIALLLAHEQITNLRRLYAQATDNLGQVDNVDAQRSGLATYHRIFTQDADIQVSGATPTLLQGTGPDAWADVARQALRSYAATQHLIGSQVVQFKQLQWDSGSQDPATPLSGRADMKSYLQAWHAWPDKRLRLVMGTYHDHVIFTPSIGWQICAMNLEHVSGEERALGS